jgi:protein TonB
MMSGRTEMATTLQDTKSGRASSTGAVIALIGPNAAHRRVMNNALSGADGRTVREFIDYPATLADIPLLMEENFDVVMIDVDSDESYALQIIQKIAAYNTSVVMVYSMRDDADLLRECMRAGARDFLPLPQDAEPPIEADVEPAVTLVQAGPIPVEDPPLNPADFLLPAAKVAPEPPISTPVPESQSYSVPSRPQFVEPRRPAPAPTPAPISAPRTTAPAEPQEGELRIADFYRDPKEAEAHRVTPQPKTEAPKIEPQKIEPEELRRPTAAQPKTEEAGASSPSEDFSAWDSLWIQPALQASQKPPAAPPQAAAAPDARRNERAAVVSGPQLVSRAQQARVQAAVPEPAPAPAAPAAPTFRQLESESSTQAQQPWVRWALMAGIPAVVIGLVMMIFMSHSGAKTPAAAPEQTVVVPQPDPPSETKTSPAAIAPVAPKAAKPSAATPIAGADTEQAAPVSSAMMDAQLNTPSKIAGSIRKPAPPEQAPGSFAPGAMEAGNALPGQLFNGSRDLKVVPSKSAISAGVAEGMLLHRTAPIYPEYAKSAHLAGTIVLGATITKQGNIANLHVLSGPPMLRGPAMEAVRTWRYRPYMLNNEPVEVETTVSVIFSLDQR